MFGGHVLAGLRAAAKGGCTPNTSDVSGGRAPAEMGVVTPQGNKGWRGADGEESRGRWRGAGCPARQDCSDPFLGVVRQSPKRWDRAQPARCDCIPDQLMRVKSCCVRCWFGHSLFFGACQIISFCVAQKGKPQTGIPSAQG